MDGIITKKVQSVQLKQDKKIIICHTKGENLKYY